MNYWRVALLLVAVLPALQAQEVRITSPDEATTFIHGSMTSHRLLWDEKKQELSAEATFTAYSSGSEKGDSETFRFRLPGVVYSAETRLFSAPTSRRTLMPVAERRKQLFGSKIETLPGVRIRVIRLKGHVQVILEADPPSPTPAAP